MNIEAILASMNTAKALAKIRYKFRTSLNFFQALFSPATA